MWKGGPVFSGSNTSLFSFVSYDVMSHKALLLSKLVCSAFVS